MKVAQVVAVFPPYKGGISMVAFHYSTQLAKLGHDVTVFTPQYRGVKFEKLSMDFKIEALTPLFEKGKAAVLPGLLRKLSKFDIVHLHYPFFGSAEIVWLLKKLKKQKMKLVLSYHMDVVGEGVMKKFFSFHTKTLMPKIVNSADKIIVSTLDYTKSSNIGPILEQHPDKFVEIPFGVTNEFFPKEKSLRLLRKYGVEGNRIVLFVGGLDKAHYFKGVDYLLEAMKLLPTDINVILVGKGDLKDKYKQQAQMLNIRNRVVFADAIEHLNEYYNIADVFVLPSIDKSEAFGIVLVEAMATATPVVASNLPGVRTVFEEAVSGYAAEPKNARDLADKILKVIEDDEVQKTMGQAARKLVEEKYLWDKIGIQLVDVYKDLLK